MTALPRGAERRRRPSVRYWIGVSSLTRWSTIGGGTFARVLERLPP
jgi:hypothetical protein